MKPNVGYRLGRHTRRVMNRIRNEERALQQRGVPGLLVKVPRYLLMAIAAGFLLAGAFYLFLFLAVLVLVAFFLSGASAGEENSGNNGYQCGSHVPGPEDSGTYVTGKKVCDDDETLF